MFKKYKGRSEPSKNLKYVFLIALLLMSNYVGLIGSVIFN